MKIAIAGYGLEGEQNYRYFVEQGHDVTIVDEKEVPDRTLPDDAQTLLGQGAFDQLKDFDMVIRTAGLAPRKIKTDGKIWSATNEFFEKCPASIIGVTGTKGKGTTSSFIASILKAAGKTVHLVGNIGTPALAALPNIQPGDIVVYELSSFQLWDIEKSPHVAVVLSIEPDHLDVHSSLEEYIGAKANITRHQTANDILVFNASNTPASEIAEISRAQKIPYPFDMSALADALVIPGAHNIENASAAVAATREYVQDEVIIRQGLASFTGLPHRIKFVRDVGGVKFYDDSYSSAPSASLAALKSFEEPKVILLGGFEKGADFGVLAEYIAKTPSVKMTVVYGAIRQRIAEALRNNGVDSSRMTVLESKDFIDIVQKAAGSAEAGDVVLLSPGSASFDMFRNFTDRGEKYIKIVEAL